MIEDIDLPNKGTISGTEFKKNSVSKIGGKIYYDCFSKDCELSMAETNI